MRRDRGLGAPSLTSSAAWLKESYKYSINVTLDGVLRSIASAPEPAMNSRQSAST
jgi:hypothetical protein